MASGVAGGTPSKQDKATFTEGTDFVVPMGAVVNDTLAADVLEDKVASPRMTPKRALHTNLRDASGNEVGTAGSPVRVDPTGTTAQPVSASSLPLPSGAATATKQDTGNTSVASIDTKTPVLGQALAAASVPVILPSATITTLTPPAAITGFATQTTLAAIDSKLGATLTVSVSGSVAVTGTFWQATQPVSAASLPLPTGAATSALQGAGLPSALGAGGGLKIDGSGTALPVSGTVTANLGTIAGVATETTLSAINTKLPAQGQAAMAASQPVVIASNQSAVPISAASLPLPSGASTAANQSSLLIELQILNGAYAMQTDESGTTTYQGWAVPGTATSAASWRIKRIIETSGDFSITWADGNNSFDNIYDNRASLSYS